MKREQIFDQLEKSRNEAVIIKGELQAALELIALAAMGGENTEKMDWLSMSNMMHRSVNALDAELTKMDQLLFEARRSGNNGNI